MNSCKTPSGSSKGLQGQEPPFDATNVLVEQAES